MKKLHSKMRAAEPGADAVPSRDVPAAEDAIEREGLTVRVDKLLTVGELARILRVERSTVYAWTHRRRIPFIKVGGAGLRFNEAEISKWIESSTVQPQSLGDPTREVRHRARRVSRSSDKAVRRIVATAREDVLGQ